MVWPEVPAHTVGHTHPPMAASTARSAAAGSSAANTAEPATNRLAPARAQGPAVSSSIPPSTSSAGRSPTRARRRSILSSEPGRKLWPPQPGIHGHAEHEVEVVDHLAHRIGGRARAQRQPGPAAGFPDRGERVVHVRRGLDVDRDPVRAGPGERVDLALRALDHQVDVDVAARRVDLRRQRLDDQRAHRQRRDEVPVHDVDVDRARARVHDLGDLLAEPGEVGGEDRRRDAGRRAGHQIGCSIELRQWLQMYSAVLDIRTIVECSPQLGHTEASSKRRRQLTQR